MSCTRCGATYGSGGTGGIGGGDISPTITPTTRPGSMYDGDEGGNATLPPVVDEEVPDETIPPETDETASEEPVQPEGDASVDVQVASQIIASETTTAYSYIYASGKLLQEKVTTNGVTETHNFFYDNTGKPYAMQVDGTTYYYITNLQGDVMGLVDTSGNSVASYTYDPYGKVLTATGILAEKNPLRYRGYYYDSESGLYYLQSRYYDPATRRFVNADSYSSTGQGLIGHNMYAYCNNSPVALSDPTGEFWEAIGIGFIAGVVGQYVSDVIGNIKQGKSGIDVLAATSSASDYLASGLGGAIAAIPGLSAVGTMVVGGIGNVVSDGLKGNIKNSQDFRRSATRGAIANGIGFLVSKGLAFLRVKQIDNMSRTNRKTYLRDNIYCTAQSEANVNIHIYADTSLPAKIALVEQQLVAFKSGAYSTATSTMTMLF